MCQLGFEEERERGVFKVQPIQMAPSRVDISVKVQLALFVIEYESCKRIITMKEAL